MRCDGEVQRGQSKSRATPDAHFTRATNHGDVLQRARRCTYTTTTQENTRDQFTVPTPHVNAEYAPVYPQPMAMTTRRVLQPLSPPSPNIDGALHSFTHTSRHSTNGFPAMNDAVHNDADALGDDFSLTSKDAEDDFERQMLQNARDERRLRDTRPGRVQAFRKARTHPRVGVTLENLKRHNAGSNAHVKFESPPSSSGSTHSDPAVQPPQTWGRKARTKRNWMRTITADNEQTPGPHGEEEEEEEEATPRADDAGAPRASVEDSPLSHRNSRQNTPVSSQPWRDDWDFDLNEASLIASTPYLPRNTALDDIRQREIESLREQGVTKNRLDRIRESSPDERRRPSSASARSATSQQNGPAEPATQDTGSPEQRMHKRTNSWQKMTKSAAVAVEGFDHSPITVYKKSTETVGVIDPRLLASAQAGSKRPTHRREDSHDLLRRLARVSSTTPSPGRSVTTRPRTAPASHLVNSSQTMVSERTPLPHPTEQPPPTRELERGQSKDKVVVAATRRQPRPTQNGEGIPSHTARAPLQDPEAADVDATPLPIDRSMLNPKTPVVTGAWIDTPRPATAARPKSRSQSPSKSLKKEYSQVKKISESEATVSVEQDPRSSSASVTRPMLPGSVLEAVVEDARANGDLHPADFGDSTINSLEDLIAPFADNADQDNPDEDTLQGLQIPMGTPRTEAERRRQQETLQLHRMNERLRTARTNIRDASRGIKRVENRVEHVDDGVDGQLAKLVQCCPCAANGGHQCAEWTVRKGFKSFFYDERLKPRRRGWGLTALSIVLIAFLAWLVLENTAWYISPLAMRSEASIEVH